MRNIPNTYARAYDRQIVGRTKIRASSKRIRELISSRRSGSDNGTIDSEEESFGPSSTFLDLHVTDVTPALFKYLTLLPESIRLMQENVDFSYNNQALLDLQNLITSQTTPSVIKSRQLDQEALHLVSQDLQTLMFLDLGFSNLNLSESEQQIIREFRLLSEGMGVKVIESVLSYTFFKNIDLATILLSESNITSIKALTLDSMILRLSDSIDASLLIDLGAPHIVCFESNGLPESIIEPYRLTTDTIYLADINSTFIRQLQLTIDYLRFGFTIPLFLKTCEPGFHSGRFIQIDIATSAVSGGATLIDDFTDSNGVELTAHKAGWFKVIGNDIKIFNNTASCTGGGGHVFYGFSGAGGNPGNNQIVRAKIGQVSDPVEASQGLGIAVRVDLANTRCYRVQGWPRDNGDSYFELQYFYFGSELTTLAEGTIPTGGNSISVGDKLELKAIGTTITFSVIRSGVTTQVLQATHSGIASGYVGLSSSNIGITVRLDDLESEAG